MLHKGGSIGYWQGEIPKVLDDIKALRPSLFCGVPRVFDRIYAGINEQVRSSGTRAARAAERRAARV
jgi:long-chain acyl-CoA synthetase